METLERTYKEIASTFNGEQALKIINTSSGKVSALAAIPIPLIDVAGATYIQISMVKKLAELHNVDTENENTFMISAFVTSLISKLISEVVEQLTISVGVNKVLGESLLKATIAGFLTKLSGEIYQDHFARGGTLDDMTLGTVADYISLQLNSDRYTVDTLVSQFMDSTLKKFGVS